jgi:predicted DNA binding protein
MPAYEARIRLVHDCFYSRLTQRFPEAAIAMWCNLNTHVFEVSSPDSDLTIQVEGELLREEVGGSSIREGKVVRIVAQKCDCGPGASSAIAEAGGWIEEPVIYKGGWEHYRVIAHEKASIADAVNSLEAKGAKVELLSLKPLRLKGVAEDLVLASSSVLAGMTDRQVKALAEACNQGYFEEPSKTDLDYLSKKAGLSRSTYAEHLRKAEGKLLMNLSAIIQLAADQA